MIERCLRYCLVMYASCFDLGGVGDMHGGKSKRKQVLVGMDEKAREQ